MKVAIGYYNLPGLLRDRQARAALPSRTDSHVFRQRTSHTLKAIMAVVRFWGADDALFTLVSILQDWN